MSTARWQNIAGSKKIFSEPDNYDFVISLDSFIEYHDIRETFLHEDNKIVPIQHPHILKNIVVVLKGHRLRMIAQLPVTTQLRHSFKCNYTGFFANFFGYRRGWNEIRILNNHQLLLQTVWHFVISYSSFWPAFIFKTNFFGEGKFRWLPSKNKVAEEKKF